jgi:hypothetical protein
MINHERGKEDGVVTMYNKRNIYVVLCVTQQNGPHRKTRDEPNIIIQINKITHVNIVKQKITRNREH